MEIVFILHKPLIPENIGAAARALMTMGFEKLRLVRPCSHLQDRARWMACASAPLLEQAEVFGSLEEALADVDFSIAATARNRKQKRPSHSPREIRALFEEKSSSLTRAAVVFGAEDSGLTNQEVELCTLTSTIPANSRYSALNLAQAVMVYAYELSTLERQDSTLNSAESEPQAVRLALEKTKQVLAALGMDPTLPAYHRVIEKVALLPSPELGLFHFLADRTLAQLNK